MANPAIPQSFSSKIEISKKAPFLYINTKHHFCVLHSFARFLDGLLGCQWCCLSFFSVASKPLLAVKPPMGFTTARRRRENKKTVCLWHLLKDDVVGSNTCYIQDNWQNIRQLSCETRMNSCYSGIEYKLSFGRAPHHWFFHYNLGLECILLFCFFNHIQ